MTSETTKGKLVWMDLEMTGLDPERDVIIEIATIITDSDLNVIAEGPDLVIHRDPALFETMDEWNRNQHTKSGLWQQVVDSKLSEAEAERQTLDFIVKHTGPGESPLCGNSIWQDRRFIARYMKKIDGYLHYRLVDVSTIKELAGRWYPDRMVKKEKKNSHRAYDDIKESIEELKAYRANFFVK